MMRGNVMHDEFWTHENNITIWDKKIRIPAWGVELTQFAFVNARSDHRLPRGAQQFFEFREGTRVGFAGSESLASGQPANSTKRLRVLSAEVIALSQVMEVRHDSFIEG